MKNLRSLIFVNLRRHKIRAWISVAGISFGVAAMMTIISVVLGAVGMFENILATESTCVVFEKNVSDLFFSSVPENQLDALSALPEVAEVHPMLVGIVSSPDHPIITCFGVRPNDSRIARARWTEGDASAFSADSKKIFLGERASGFLKAHVGETVHIGKGEFEVGGVLRTKNGFEDGGIFIPLALAQEYFHREGFVSIATVKLRSDSGVARFKADVDSQFPSLVALENQEFNQSYSQFKIMRLTGWAVGICSFLLGGMSVGNTMLMSVFSRVREIAILRVCGFSKGQVAALVFGEASLIALAGSACGFALGAGALIGLNAAPQLQGYVSATVRPDLLVAIAVIALCTAAAGALYPAYFASKIQPAEALRFE